MADLEEWSEDVQLTVWVRVKAKPNPDYFEGWKERKPSDLAISAVLTGRYDPSTIDGFADLIGDADIIDVTVDG